MMKKNSNIVMLFDTAKNVTSFSLKMVIFIKQILIFITILIYFPQTLSRFCFACFAFCLFCVSLCVFMAFIGTTSLRSLFSFLFFSLLSPSQFSIASIFFFIYSYCPAVFFLVLLFKRFSYILEEYHFL